MPFLGTKSKREIGKNAAAGEVRHILPPSRAYLTSWHQPCVSGRSPYWMPCTVS